MADTVHNLDQPIGALIDIAVREFGDVEFETVNVGDITLEVLQIKNMQKYLDKLIDKTRAGKKNQIAFMGQRCGLPVLSLGIH